MLERSRWGGGWALGERVMAGAGERSKKHPPRSAGTWARQRWGRASRLFAERKLLREPIKAEAAAWLLQFTRPRRTREDAS